MKLVYSGDTNYENCEKLVLLEKTLKCLEKYGEHEKLYQEDHGEKPLSKDQIMSWVYSMRNADGTHGGHWTMDQTEQVRKKCSIECDPVMFWAAMNMMYSDYCKAVEKAGTVSADLYAYMAKAFLDDKDAKPHKLSRYYHYIAQK